MNFQTKIPLKPQGFNQIDYTSKVVLLGSCFSTNIGDKFQYFKFKSLQNPFGILFHPLAIERLISHTINRKKFEEEDLFFQNEQWHCFNAHSAISNVSKEIVLERLNVNIKETNTYLHNTTHIVITLGTAWAYRLKETHKFVANCHKVPQQKFTKELLSVDTIIQSLENIVRLITAINPDVNFIFTVSPVRHIKDGFIENTQSKAHLISAIHQLLSRQSGKNLYYFPSYELMMDEMRDYRFYNADMLHPNQVAIDYIWEKFNSVWINKESVAIMKEVDMIQKSLSHKPLNPNSKAHQKFLSQTQEKINTLKLTLPHILFKS